MGGKPHAVKTGDFNGDGALDLAVTKKHDAHVSVLLGAGDGSFSSPRDYSVGWPPARGLVIGDVDGDGILDLAVSNNQHEDPGDHVSVLLGRGDGSFGLSREYATGKNPSWLAAGDLDSNGILDLAVPNWGSGTVTVLLNPGSR